MNKVMCGKCRTYTISKNEGIHYCWFCGQGHEIKKDEELIIVFPYPRPEEKSNDDN